MTQSLKIYNTLTRKKETFTPIDPSSVGLYVCGPTVYDFAHIGNARPVVVFDVLVRVLKTLYPKVTYVRNITDIDDKINAASKATGEPIRFITERTEKAYQEDMAALGALEPTIQPRATDHISEMIHMIQLLVQKGYAYENQGHVLFDVSKDKKYGHLSKKNQEDLIAGARVEVAPYKKNPADFVLWKPSDSETPGWDSPWGRGRPGWHIECSAMAAKYLGLTFDIHGGGIDLCFPHHENEIAQSCAAHSSTTFAQYWMHNGHLTVDGDKMSKSLGNFLTVRDLLSDYPGEVLRYFLMSSHYRQPLDLNHTLLSDCHKSLDRLYGVLRAENFTKSSICIESISTYKFDEDVFDSLLDDLNTPAALSHLHQLASSYYKEENPHKQKDIAVALREGGFLLGILQDDPELWFKILPKDLPDALSSDEIDLLISQRNDARKKSDYKESDRIRDFLFDKGVVLEDSQKGTMWRRR